MSLLSRSLRALLTRAPLSLHLTQEEQRALEAKYAALYSPLYGKRAGIVSGAADVEHPAEEAAAEAPAGVPEFWLTALRNHELLDEQARTHACTHTPTRAARATPPALENPHTLTYASPAPTPPRNRSRRRTRLCWLS